MLMPHFLWSQQFFVSMLKGIETLFYLQVLNFMYSGVGTDIFAQVEFIAHGPFM